MANVTRGSKKYCEAFVAYAKRELTFADPAKPTVVPNTEWDKESEPFIVQIDDEAARHWSVSYLKMRESATDFRHGWIAAGGK